MKYSSKSTILSMTIAVVTLLGLALHEARLDAVAGFALTLPVVAASYGNADTMVKLGGASHTHVERVSVGNMALRQTSLNPWLASRHNQDKKYRLQKNAPKGHHPFDNYSLPVIG